MKGLCDRVCSQCAMYGKYCSSCSLCEAALCQKNCGLCTSLCFKRPGAYLQLKGIGGPELYIKENTLIDLPVHIPILPDRLRQKPNYEMMPMIAIHGRNMFSSNGEKISKTYLEKGFKRALNIDERTKGILQFYVQDRTLEGFWDNRRNIYPDLREMKLHSVIAPNFSVYEDAPRIDHIYNIKRSSRVYNELLDAGISAIPDISWYDQKDLERWCKAIQENNIKTIAFSFQVVDTGLRAANIWKSYLLGFRYLCENIPSDVRIILAGMVSPRKIQEIYKATTGQKLCILNQSAYVQSRRGILSETKKSQLDLNFDELFEKNVIYYNKIYEEISQDFEKGGVVCLKQEEAIQ